uniref:transglutaminase domain-containing protein n=1 Tax=Acetatifactor sp. TaxID=1872090 RepID=UPI0040561744
MKKRKAIARQNRMNAVKQRHKKLEYRRRKAIKKRQQANRKKLTSEELPDDLVIISEGNPWYQSVEEDVADYDSVSIAAEEATIEEAIIEEAETDDLVYIDLQAPAKKEPEKKPSKKLRIALICSAAVLLIGGIIGFIIYQNSLVYKTCYVEAGISVGVSDFLRRPDAEAYFTENSDAIDTTVPGEYHLEIKTGFFAHPSTLYVQDTIAPVVEVQAVEVLYGDTYEASDFVADVTDVTETVISYYKEPDISQMGQQVVMIAVTDAGNNVTTAAAELMVTPVLPAISVEVGGEAPELSDFLLVDGDAKLITRLDKIDYTQLGVHTIKVKVDGKFYKSEMEIVDTVAPVFEVQSLEGFTMLEREAADFVTSAEDMTEITYSYETAPDFTYSGTQTVTIVATDEGGNQTLQQAELTLENDTEAPKFTRANDFTVYIGDSISYKSQVKVKDNCEEGLELTVDSSAVNRDVAGTYPVVYTATDAAGNTTSVTINMTIKKHAYDEAELYAMIDPILARIITDDMSQYDKTWAIFTYIKGHVGYISYSEKGDWIKSACEGLLTGRGDCYVYASLSKAMLTRAGITNMDIQKIQVGDSMHFWNLVDIGDGHGWYHFDTTPRKDRPTIFLWDEATLTDYSDRHNKSHNYDRSLYPTVY